MYVYKNQSRELLKVFLNEWSRKTDSCINSQRFEPIQKEVAELYVFVVSDSIQAKINYNYPIKLFGDSVPPNYSKLTSSLFQKAGSENRYLVIPEKVRVTISEFVNGMKSKNNLKDTSVIFAPCLDIDNLRLLHANKKYDGVINKFLGVRSYYSKEELKNRKFIKYSEKKKRAKFLKQELDMYEGHWDGWILEANPRVYSISFNENLTLAEVSIGTYHYAGVTALFRKLNGKWCFDDVIGVWTE
jgi:hypothetical protein